MHWQSIEQQAARTEVRSRERTCARRDAMPANAFLARIIPGYAIQLTQRRLRAKQTWVVPRVCQSSDLHVTASRGVADSQQIPSAERVASSPGELLARSVEEQGSSREGVAACG